MEWHQDWEAIETKSMDSQKVGLDGWVKAGRPKGDDSSSSDGGGASPGGGSGDSLCRVDSQEAQKQGGRTSGRESVTSSATGTDRKIGSTPKLISPADSRDGKRDTGSGASFRFKQGTGGLLTRVQFQVSCVTRAEDEIWVVGSIPSLGCWQPRSGVRLRTDAAVYPIWTASIEVPSGIAVEYKYVIQHSEGRVVVQWEDRISNRMFTPEGVFVLLEDGRFNVERAKLFDRQHKQLAVDREGRTSKYNSYSDTEVRLTPNETVYIVSYLLPLKTVRNAATGEFAFSWHPGYTSNTSSRHAMYVLEKLHNLNEKVQIWYVGWLGVEVSPEQQDEVTETLKRDFQCLPVFMSTTQARDFQDFTDSILRPIFHFVAPTEPEMCTTYTTHHSAPVSDQATPAGPRSPRKQDSTGNKWLMYNKVNLMYVEPLVERFNDGDVVLVFDMELTMVPSIVGSRCRSANVGYVFSTPFPSSDIFRMLPSRKEIMRSLLNSDMIHFQCFTYARHFLTCCSRLLGLEYHSIRGGLAQVNFNGHRVQIRASHVGMDTKTLVQNLSTDPSVREHKALWRDRIAGRRVVLGYDELEPMSGITLLLTACQSLTNLFPSTLGNVVWVIVAIPLTGSDSRHLHAEYAARVEQMVADINSRHPGLVMYFKRRMPFSERTALFASSDVLVNSSIRHGLNLMPFEFVMCSKERKAGFVVSEFVGCSRVLPGAVRTNPWRDEDMARAIHRLLLLEDHHKEYWHGLQVDFCTNNTVYSWAENLLKDMLRMRRTMLEMGEDVSRAGCRVGIAKMTHKEMSHNYLKVEQVYKAYSVAEARLIVVDIDLLLRPVLHPEKAMEGSSYLVSRNEIMKCLQHVAGHPGNVLWLLSSATPQELKSWFGDMQGLEQIGLAAEDGYCYKWPGSPVGRWDIKMEINNGWKDVALGLMRQYTERTNGSYVDDEKTTSLTWHWERCNPDFGTLQGKELQNHLKEMLSHFPVRIIKGKTYVRVRHEGVTKGALVEHVIKHYNTRGGVDFVLGLGDDVADCDMFEVIAAYHRDAQYRVVSSSKTMKEVKVFTCCVGRQPSVANYCLYCAEEVFELMSGLYLQIKRLGRYHSMVELSSPLSSKPLSI